jgi:hypothetical protein
MMLAIALEAMLLQACSKWQKNQPHEDNSRQKIVTRSFSDLILAAKLYQYRMAKVQEWMK